MKVTVKVNPKTKTLLEQRSVQLAPKTVTVEAHSSKKLARKELMFGIFRLLRFILLLLLGYSLIVAFALAVSYALFPLWDKAFNLGSLVSSVSEWASLNPGVLATAAIVLYLAGFVWFGYAVLKKIAASQTQ